jgi:hypothetical protein
MQNVSRSRFALDPQTFALFSIICRIIFAFHRINPRVILAFSLDLEAVMPPTLIRTIGSNINIGRFAQTLEAYNAFPRGGGAVVQADRDPPGAGCRTRCRKGNPRTRGECTNVPTSDPEVQLSIGAFTVWAALSMVSAAT